MPRIEAQTVAEHRANQLGVLLEAAERLLLEQGWDGLTFAALGRAAGLSRNGVYEYFKTRSDVVAALCERDFPRWQEQIEAAMTRASTPAEQIGAYVDVQLRLVGDGRHRLGPIIQHAPLNAPAAERIHAWHRRWLDLLHAPLAHLGDTTPEITAALIQGVVEAATIQIETGTADPRHVSQRARELIHRAVTPD
jgi:AcrR family transcriptional regulator